MFKWCSITVFCVLLTASHATAEESIEWVEVDNSAVLTGYRTFDIYMNSEAGVCCAGLVYELTQGSFYYFHSDTHPFLNDLVAINEPPPQQLFDILGPTLPEVYQAEYTTYFTIGGVRAAIPGAAAIPGVGDVLEHSEQEIDISWYGGSYPTGHVHMGRVTVTDDAVGTWIMHGKPGGQPTVISTGVIPEPASLTLLCVTGLLFCCRPR